MNSSTIVGLLFIFLCVYRVCNYYINRMLYLAEGQEFCLSFRKVIRIYLGSMHLFIACPSWSTTTCNKATHTVKPCMVLY